MTPISYSSILIGTNRILEYIRQFPEARTPLLLWYKCFAYREGGIDPAGGSIINGSSNLDVINYPLFWKINPWLKVACIDFFGTQEQARQWHLNKIRSQYPDEEITTETILIESVELDIDESYFSSTNLPASEVESEEPITEIQFSTYYSNYTIETALDYEAALNRIDDLFESKPGSSDFEELSETIGAIKTYEDESIHIPDLDAVETIEWQMKIRGEIPACLLDIFATETDVTDFLAGNKAISLKQLKALCKHYRIQFLYPELEENLRDKKLIT